MRVVLLVAFLCLPAWARAEDEPPGRVAAEVAKDVVTAFAAGNDAGLTRLAEEVPPDPWIVADLLCAQAKHEAATAYAQAAPGPDISHLPHYIDRRRTLPTPPKLRIVLAEARRLLAAGRLKEAQKLAKGHHDGFAAMAGRAPEQLTVTHVGLLVVEGRAAVARSRSYGIERLTTAAQTAIEMGWRTKARALVVEAAAALPNMPFEQIHNPIGKSVQISVLTTGAAIGAYEAAIEPARAAMRTAVEQNDLIFTGHIGLALGSCLMHVGRLAEAETVLEQALRSAEALGFPTFVGPLLSARAVLARRQGRFRLAIARREEEITLWRGAGAFPHQLHQALDARGHLFQRTIDYPRALNSFEEALAVANEMKQPTAIAHSHQMLASLYLRLGSSAKAEKHAESAAKHLSGVGKPLTQAATWLGIGRIYGESGDLKAALDAQRRALKLYEVESFEAGIASASASIGVTRSEQGDFQGARTWRLRALAKFRQLGHDAMRARILSGNGVIWARHGEVDEGLRMLAEAAQEAARLELPELAFEVASQRATIQHRRGRHEQALASARAAVALAPRLMRGLAASESAGVRERNASVFEVGAMSAWRLGRHDETVQFLERGRAGALLESLGGRERLREASVPPALALAEVEARARETRAQQRFRETLGSRSRRVLRQAKKELAAARSHVAEVVARIQREARAAADILYPGPAATRDIQAALAPDQALVLYALLPGRALAVVLTSATMRLIDLGPTEAIAQLADLHALDPDTEWTQAQGTALSERLIEPLALPAEVRQVLVSPAGALSYLPFALLVPDRVVGYIPSGTTLVWLTRQRAPRGEGVLAIGDPDYRGTKLPPLPNTRLEAETLGTTVLVGQAATEAGLKAATATGKRWRSLHFACHGLIDTERPLLSNLALTPDAKNDGSLTALDVMRLALPADLAALSACETARGRIYRAEGIVGLTRAFMVAGSARVLCSLWKVDDEATRVLMTRFYELWNPKDGPGLPPAQALREAQAFVRSEEKWREPLYWAAWTLWGLPD